MHLWQTKAISPSQFLLGDFPSTTQVDRFLNYAAKLEEINARANYPEFFKNNQQWKKHQWSFGWKRFIVRCDKIPVPFDPITGHQNSHILNGISSVFGFKHTSEVTTTTKKGMAILWEIEAISNYWQFISLTRREWRTLKQTTNTSDYSATRAIEEEVIIGPLTNPPSLFAPSGIHSESMQ